MSDYTQAVCFDCWDEHNPDRKLRSEQRDNVGPPEVCCYCGETTGSGIYIRVDPDTVPHATRS